MVFIVPQNLVIKTLSWTCLCYLSFILISPLILSFVPAQQNWVGWWMDICVWVGQDEGEMTMSHLYLLLHLFFLHLHGLATILLLLQSCLHLMQDLLQLLLLGRQTYPHLLSLRIQFCLSLQLLLQLVSLLQHLTQAQEKVWKIFFKTLNVSLMPSHKYRQMYCIKCQVRMCQCQLRFELQ